MAKAKTGTMAREAKAKAVAQERKKKVGGVAYRPEHLLDCVLPCDNLLQPGLMKPTIIRSFRPQTPNP